MSSVVAIHGIGNAFVGESVLHQKWFPAMRDGLIRAGSDLHPDDLACTFYGDLFRPAERVLAGETPWYDASDVTDGFETELLTSWWQSGTQADPAVIAPGAHTLARTPRLAQAALNALSNSRFFAGIAERLMVFSLKQVRMYLTEPGIRDQAIARVERLVDVHTRVLVGHSLGSVVAYEALCRHPEWPVRTLVTLGSPLGVRNLIFDRLHPEPGGWPGSITHWTNLADEGDVVAMQKDLRPLFGDRVTCVIVHCGAKAHDATRYLTTEAAGRAIMTGLAHG